MSSTGWEDKRLGDLDAPRRNRYFYGQLMDVRRFSMEQEHVLAERRQMNRLVLGPGVVCGLGVSPIESGPDRGLRVQAGMAVDGWGRRIVVPDPVDLIPLQVTDRCGVAIRPPDGAALPKNLVVSLCYRECQTEFAPALVPDPGCESTPRCEAGTWVETYTLCVREGAARDVVHPCDSDIKAMLRRGSIHEALCALTAACGDFPEDPCLVLANIAVEDDGSLTVQACPPRPVVPTNQALLRLIACLAERIEECCGPTPAQALAVQAVSLWSNTALVAMKSPVSPLTVRASREPSGLVVEFANAIVDPATVVAGSSLIVLYNGAPVDGRISWLAGNRMRFSVQGAFPKGDYSVELRGEPPAVMSMATGNTPAHALDGEPGGSWPTGDGQPGGNFAFTFSVTA